MQDSVMTSMYRKTSHLPEHAMLCEETSGRVTAFYHDRVQEAWGGRHLLCGRPLAPNDIQLMSNDYLDLSSHEEVVASQCQALRESGNGLMMSGIYLLQGNEPQRVLEDSLAEAFEAEAVVLCQSGYAANVGLIQSIANQKTPIYIDMFAHMSLWEGAKSAGATVVPFNHNDPKNLQRKILRHGCGIVVVDAVYSTNGSLCLLTELVDVAERDACTIVVDESHSLGTHGPNGEGLVAAIGLSHRVHFRTASLAKAYCTRAGMITCPRAFKTYFGSESLPAIFSSALLPHDLAGIASIHRIIRRDGWRRAALWKATRTLRAALTSMGYPISDGSEQIIGLEGGAERLTMDIRDVLEENGIIGSVFCAPATAKNRSLLRLSLNAGLNDVTVNHVIDVFERLVGRLRPSAWSAAIRQAKACSASS